MWRLLAGAEGLEAEVRSLLAEARAAYKRKGGVLAAAVEQSLKLGRLLAGLQGPGARKEVAEMVAGVMEQVGECLTLLNGIRPVSGVI